MASESIPLFKNRWKSVFNAVLGAVMPGVRIDRHEAEPILQFLSDRLFFTNAPKETGRMFLAFGIQ